MFCSKCSSKLEDNAQFCSNCGVKIENTQMPVNNIPNPVDNNDKKERIIKGSIIGVLLFIIVVLITIIIKNGMSNGESSILEEGSHSRTIMIYMVGSNLESDAKIVTAELEAIKPELVDLNNVKVLLYTGGTEIWHNFISNQENAIYELKENGFEKVKTYSKENMGDARTLETFLDYSYENYKTDRYNLIFYNHGGAIDGAIYDDFSNDHLSIREFKIALAASNFSKTNKLELVLFRTCLNGTLEIANAFKDYAHYLVASEEVTNGGSKASVLNFINDIESTDNPVDYGKKFINAYDEQMQILDPTGFGSNPMYSIIDLSKIEILNKELERFMKGVDISKYYSDIVRVRSNLYQYGYTFYNNADYDMVDLYTLVKQIQNYSSVKNEDLLKAIDEAVIYNWSILEDSKGISIFFPYKGSKEIQNYFIDIYDDFDFSGSYTKFIKQFNSLSTSNQSSSFSSINLYENEVSVNETGEFALELTDDQVKDYAESIYIVFKKDENDYYMPIYSSDNTKVEGNTLKTNIADNLVRVKDSDGTSYIQLTERSKGEKLTYLSQAILFDFSDGMDTVGVNVHFDYKDNKPYIAKLSVIEEDVISARFVDINDYDFIHLPLYRYKILDEAGNYTQDWEGNPEVKAYELNLKEEYEFEKASLDDGEYYCVFKVYDIYGNYFYSDLKSIN